MKSPYPKATTIMLHKLADDAGLEPTQANMIPALYLADRMCLLETGRTITRDAYLLENGVLSIPGCEKFLSEKMPSEKELELASYHLSEMELEAMQQSVQQIKDGFDIHSLPEFKVCDGEITPKDIVMNAGLDNKTTKGLLEIVELEEVCDELFT